jgi:hypothetical protein
MRAAIIAAALALACAAPAKATWKPQYAQAPQAVQDWYQHAELTPAAAKRLGFVGCCDDADVVNAKFRFTKEDGNPAWYFQRAGVWLRIPDDIIHWDQSAPDNKPTLFALAHDTLGQPAGTLTCFYPPSGGF